MEIWMYVWIVKWMNAWMGTRIHMQYVTYDIHLPNIPTVDRNFLASLVFIMSINRFMTMSASHWPSLMSRLSLWFGNTSGLLFTS